MGCGLCGRHSADECAGGDKRKKIEATPLTNTEIAAILRNYKTLPLGMSKEQDFRISIAGVQEKTALLWHSGQWQRPHNPYL
jgi:serine/threonine-protein kinase HipA